VKIKSSLDFFASFLGQAKNEGPRQGKKTDKIGLPDFDN